MSFFVVILPLISGLVCRIAGDTTKAKIVSYIAVILMFISSFCSIITWAEIRYDDDAQHIILLDWIELLNFKSHWAIYVDKLTALMLMVVSLISTIVHIHSIGYMQDDKNLYKFISYLSFFTFFMLMLVSSDNFLQLFFGWEGVGVSSYLLIGFWHKKYTATIAAYKAFIVNRFADCAFILGIIVIIYFCHSVDFDIVFNYTPQLAKNFILILGFKISILNLICLLLFIGCIGKSAQIGLHIWLPDAMEGPTPASALIHAATMVTAGIFLLVRCSFMFEYAPLILNFIAIIGGLTCIVAASIAIFQSDIKKVIAYSTCSQLGYMVAACGVSAYSSAIFHLITHAFFKAMLFLCAGNIIHVVHQQDMKKMPDQLCYMMPYTYILFWLGSLAIIGVFPLSGYYSKDVILEHIYISNSFSSSFVYLLGIITVFFTAIYSIKLILGIFHQISSFPHMIVIKEAPLIMNLPLLVLAFATIISGWYGYSILSITKPAYFGNSVFSGSLKHAHINWIVRILPIIVGVLGVMVGAFAHYYKSYYDKKSALIKGFIQVVKNKYYFDELYNAIFVKSFNSIADSLSIFDAKYVNKFGADGVVLLLKTGFFGLKKLQSGYLAHYILIATLAMVTFLTFIIVNYFIIGY